MRREEEERPTARADYEVGYRRPPRQHQFKPGASGNPRGRPRGARGMKTILSEALAEKVAVNKGGKVRKISKLELMLAQQVNKAAAGDAKAFDQVMKLLPTIEASEETGTTPDAIADDIRTLDDLISLRRSYQERHEDGNGSE